MQSAIGNNVDDAPPILEDEKEVKKYLRRMKRACQQIPDAPTSEELMQGTSRIPPGNQNHSDTMAQLAADAKTSVTARDLVSSAFSAASGMNSFEHGDIRTAATLLGYAYRTNTEFVGWNPSQIPNALRRFQELAQKRDEEPSVRADALVIRSFLLFFRGHMDDGMLALRLAQHLLPKDASLHALEGRYLALQAKRPEAVAAFTKAAELGSNDIEVTLFLRAVLSDDGAKARGWLEEFLKRAEPDAQKLPEACYRLALLYGIQGPHKLGAARRCYERGLQAEKVRLPYYAGQDISGIRNQAATLAEKYRACGNPACDVLGTNICVGCKTICYCSRNCQAKDWKRHKPECKRIQATL